MNDKNAKPQIWISPRDKNGRSVDPRLIEIGYKLFPKVMSFAIQMGLPDTSCVPEIIERVVHAASRNNGSGSSIQESSQYIYSACKYEIFHLANREWLTEPANQEDFEAAIDLRTLDSEADIHQRIRVEQALSNIHGKHRDLLILFSQSYPWEHIGALLGMTPESARTLCYRLIRRIREAMGVKFKAKGNPSEEIE
ncbi:MAG: sigma-70 family RNA polymerase sigma factor [Acidobacteria bacterium]|nr:sigma-70 family RNA polymerase sigma factor [Acidobacteriota bacterium]